MRKALLSVLLVLLIILIALFMKNGLHIGSFRIFGFKDINEKNAELTNSIANANTQSSDYTNTLTKIDTDVEGLIDVKKDYLDAIAQNTEDDIRRATQTKTYMIEYLWSRVGNHATSQGINLVMNLSNSTINSQDYRNLNFTADGEYLAICQFIYELENDANLDFTIDDFHMTNSSGNNVQARFVVKDVKIQQESTTTTDQTTYTVDSDASQSDSNNVDNADNTTSTDNTENTRSTEETDNTENTNETTE